MIKKIQFLFPVLSLAIILHSCSTEQINAAKSLPENFKEVTLNTSGINPQSIEEVKLDGKKLSSGDFSIIGNQIKLNNITEGRHILTIKYAKYGYVDIPIELNKNNGTVYQFNPNISNNKINEWEVGIDTNKDGYIDPNKFYSRTIGNYVAVRDFSGNTNYIPQNNLNIDFKNQKNYPKPQNIATADLSENFLKPDSNPLFFPGERMKMPQGAKNDRPGALPEKVSVPVPQQFSGYKINAVLVNDRLLPESDYNIQNSLMTYNGNFLREGMGIIKLYLIDETGQGILLLIQPRKPVLPPSERMNIQNPPKEISIGADDVSYFMQKGVTITPEELQKLRQNIILQPKQPFEQKPPGVPMHSPGMVPGTTVNTVPEINEMLVPIANKSTSANQSRLVKIDKDGEITGIIQKDNSSEKDVEIKEITGGQSLG